MLIYPSAVYAAETHIVWLDEALKQLPFIRIGLVADNSRVANQLGRCCASAYQHVVAFSAVKIDHGFCRRLHRVAYLNVAGGVDGIDADTESDNLATPASFIAGEPLTEAPTAFGLPRGGPLGELQNRWRREAAILKQRWDRHFKLLGLPPLQSSVERWGDYTTPGY